MLCLGSTTNFSPQISGTLIKFPPWRTVCPPPILENNSYSVAIVCNDTDIDQCAYKIMRAWEGENMSLTWMQNIPKLANENSECERIDNIISIFKMIAPYKKRWRFWLKNKSTSGWNATRTQSTVFGACGKSGTKLRQAMNTRYDLKVSKIPLGSRSASETLENKLQYWEILHDLSSLFASN